MLAELLTSANVLAVLAKAEADTEAEADTDSKNPPYPLVGGEIKLRSNILLCTG